MLTIMFSSQFYFKEELCDEYDVNFDKFQDYFYQKILLEENDVKIESIANPWSFEDLVEEDVKWITRNPQDNLSVQEEIQIAVLDQHNDLVVQVAKHFQNQSVY